MFRVRNTILSDDIATAKFACDLGRCKGACCVVGDAGAPVAPEEVPALRKSWRLLKDELPEKARKVVSEEGLIQKNVEGYEISCVDGAECVFVQYDEEGVAHCAIQKAFFGGRLSWEKPISCHLFPVRLKKIAGFVYANYEYVPSIYSSACARGEKEEIYLSDFLERALVRRYGREWYVEFCERCEEIRTKQMQSDSV